MEVQGIAKLEEELKLAESAYEAAKRESSLRHTWVVEAANKLAQTHAQNAWITVGTLIDFEYGRGISRARVEEITKQRWNYYGNVFDLHVRVILRDGSAGKRLCIVESSHFQPTKGFGSIDGERKPRAKLVAE